ncbi:hypothetical protein EDB89DRAFT_1900221 [Lactarius sanguifluus]|nr:hypothetical protein EDB89DRAFT_1900221 [Lactarius sanguifluus]
MSLYGEIAWWRQPSLSFHHPLTLGPPPVQLVVPNRWSSPLSDNVQPSSLMPRPSNPSPPAWPQRRRRGIVHVMVAYFEMVWWNQWVDVRCSHHYPVNLIFNLDTPSGCLNGSVRFPDPPFLVSTIFLTTLSIWRLSFEALGVLLHAFPSAVAVARPLSLSDLRPTAVYGWAVFRLNNFRLSMAALHGKLSKDLVDSLSSI